MPFFFLMTGHSKQYNKACYLHDYFSIKTASNICIMPASAEQPLIPLRSAGNMLADLNKMHLKGNFDKSGS